MRQIIGILLIVLISIVLFSCANKAQTGAGVGALGGAAVGSHLGPEDDESRLTNAAIGAGIGALFGYAIGNELDKYDKRQVSNTLERNPDGRPSEWRNPNTNKRYRATPTETYDRGREPTRDIRLKADTNGDGRFDETVHARARRVNGRWELER